MHIFSLSYLFFRRPCISDPNSLDTSHSFPCKQARSAWKVFQAFCHLPHGSNGIKAGSLELVFILLLWKILSDIYAWTFYEAWPSIMNVPHNIYRLTAWIHDWYAVKLHHTIYHPTQNAWYLDRAKFHRKKAWRVCGLKHLKNHSG